MDSKDRRRFDGAIAKLLYTLNGTHSPNASMIGAYWSILKAYSWQQVADVMTKAIKESTGHISPLGLAQMLSDRAAADAQIAREYEADRLAEVDKANEEGRARFGNKLWRNAEFRIMKNVANMAYGRRCLGQSLEPLWIPSEGTEVYAGGFDYKAVVEAAPVAKDWSPFWSALKAEFEAYLTNQALSETAPYAL